MTTRRVLIIIVTFDIFCLICSVILFLTAVLGLISKGQLQQDPKFKRKHLIYVCVVLGGYGLLSVFCNCLASFGIKKRRRYFLVPYLVFIPMVLSLLFIILITVLCTKGVNEFLAVPVVICLVLSYVWVKLLKQWSIMSQIPTDNQQENIDIDRELASVLAILDLSQRQAIINLSQGNAGETIGGVYNDPPPRYESLEVENCPPCYEEAVLKDLVQAQHVQLNKSDRPQ